MGASRRGTKHRSKTETKKGVANSVAQIEPQHHPPMERPALDTLKKEVQRKAQPMNRGAGVNQTKKKMIADKDWSKAPGRENKQRIKLNGHVARQQSQEKKDVHLPSPDKSRNYLVKYPCAEERKRRKNSKDILRIHACPNETAGQRVHQKPKQICSVPGGEGCQKRKKA